MIFVRTAGTGMVRLCQIKTYTVQTWLSPVFAWLLMAFMTHKYAQHKAEGVNEIHSLMMTIHDTPDMGYNQ